MTDPGSGALAQVERLLMLVPWLHGRDEARLEDAAELLGVDRRQVVRDLKVLLMCGLPEGLPDDLIDVDLDAIEGPDAEGVIRVSNADYLSRPLRLDPTEASALIVALRAVRSGGGPETAEVVDRVLVKLEAAAAEGGARAPVEVGAEPDDGEVARLREQLAGALREGRRVRLAYYVPTRDEESSREVDPRRLVTAGGYHYLDAWCHSAEAPRLFRLDRIHEAEVLEEAASVTTGAPQGTDTRDPVARATGLFHPGEGVTRVTLELAPPAFWVREYYPVQRVHETAAGNLEVELLAADPRWMRRLLLRLAPHARVLSPSGVHQEFLDEARRSLALYS